MDRCKKSLTKRLTAVSIILAAALALFVLAAGRVVDKPQPPTPAAQMPSRRPPRKAYQPLPPRLLPHSAMHVKACRPGGGLARLEKAGKDSSGSPREAVHPVAFPPVPANAEPPLHTVRQTAQTQAVPSAAGTEQPSPQYTWLLEGRADVPAKTSRRSLQLERIAQEADSHIRYGFSLANRGAFYAARAEFVKALRLVAQGLDAEHQTAVHGRALRAGLRALDEADDFLPSGSQLESDLDLQAIIRRHHTPVLRVSQPRTLTSLEALHRYFGFAQYQLGVAGGGELSASMALHAMAKLYGSSVDNPTLSVLSAKPKAMTCFQAALVCYPGNYLAANDLGVLLAGEGRFDDARRILEAGAAACPHSTIWRNLAVVYRRLGLNDRVRKAQQHQQLSLQKESAGQQACRPGASDPRVCWLSPEEFAKTYAQTLDARQPLPVHQSPAKIGTQTAAGRARPVEVEKANPLIESKSTTSWSWNILAWLKPIIHKQSEPPAQNAPPQTPPNVLK